MTTEDKYYFACPFCGAVHTFSLFSHAGRKCYFCRKKFQTGQKFKDPYNAYKAYLASYGLSFPSVFSGELSLSGEIL